MFIEVMEKETMEIPEVYNEQKTPQEKLRELDRDFFEARDRIINDDPKKVESNLEEMRGIFKKIKDIYMQEMEKKE